MARIKEKSEEKFTIILSDKLFFDPNFQKENYKYWALNTAFWRSKVVDNLSPSATKVLLQLFISAQEVRSKYLSSDVLVFSKQRLRMQPVYIELERFQILTRHPFLINKQINELIDEKKPFQLTLEKDSQEIFAKHFQKFVMETIGSADLGFVNSYWKKAHEAFLTTKAFDEFCSTVTSRQNFISGDWKDQFSYFQVSLKEEIKNRGVK